MSDPAPQQAPGQKKNAPPLLSRNGVDIYGKMIPNHETGEMFEVFNIRERRADGTSTYTTCPTQFGDYQLTAEQAFSIYKNEWPALEILSKSPETGKEYSIFLHGIVNEIPKPGRDMPDLRIKLVSGFADIKDDHIRGWIIPENDKTNVKDLKVWATKGPEKRPVQLTLADAIRLRDGVKIERDGLLIEAEGIVKKPGPKPEITYKDLQVKWSFLDKTKAANYAAERAAGPAPQQTAQPAEQAQPGPSAGPRPGGRR